MKIPYLIRAIIITCIFTWSSRGLSEGLTITTTSGRVFRDCEVFNYDAEGITVMHSKGVSGIKFSELPPEIQEKYGYDAEEADKLRLQREEAKREREIALRMARERRIAQEAAARKRTQHSQVKVQNHQINHENNRQVVKKRSEEVEAVVEVVQVLNDGFLARVSLKEDTFGKLRRSLSGDWKEMEDFVMIRTSSAFAKERYDRERIRIKIYPAGFYRYTTVLGAQKTVLRFATTPEMAVQLSQ